MVLHPQIGPVLPRFVFYRSLSLSLSHTHTHTHRVDRTPLNKWSACCRGCYLLITQIEQEINIHAFSGFGNHNQSSSCSFFSVRQQLRIPSMCYSIISGSAFGLQYEAGKWQVVGNEEVTCSCRLENGKKSGTALPEAATSSTLLEYHQWFCIRCALWSRKITSSRKWGSYAFMRVSKE